MTCAELPFLPLVLWCCGAIATIKTCIDAEYLYADSM